MKESTKDLLPLVAIYAATWALGWDYYSSHQGFVQLGGRYAEIALYVYGLLGLIVAVSTWLWAVRILEPRSVL